MLRQKLFKAAIMTATFLAVSCAHNLDAGRAPASEHGKSDDNSSFVYGWSKGDPFASFYSKAFNKGGRSRKRRRKPNARSGNAGPSGNCARFVKEAYLAMGCVKSYPNCGSAKNCDGPMRKLGFSDYRINGTKVMNPCDAPVGAAIVYGGKGAGHMEIRTRRGFLSDYLSLAPRTAGFGSDRIMDGNSLRDPRNAKPWVRGDVCKQSGSGRKVKAILLPPPGCKGFEPRWKG